LRGLGFSEGEALLKPPAPPSGPQPPVAPIAPKTPAEETAGRIVATYGKTVEGVIRSTFVVDAEGRIQVARYNVRATGHVASLRRELALD